MFRRKWMPLGVTAALVFLPSCYTDRYDEPEVRSVSPVANATDVPVDAVIRVEFDRRMRASTLDGRNFYVWDVDADIEVAGTRSYEIDTRTAVFLSDELFLPNRRYRVIVDRDVRSERYGLRLRHARVWEFTTGAASMLTTESGLSMALLQAVFDSDVEEMTSDEARATYATAIANDYVLERHGVASGELTEAVALRLLDGSN